jgi:hypothetical protein
MPKNSVGDSTFNNGKRLNNALTDDRQGIQDRNLASVSPWGDLPDYDTNARARVDAPPPTSAHAAPKKSVADKMAPPTSSSCSPGTSLSLTDRVDLRHLLNSGETDGCWKSTVALDALVSARSHRVAAPQDSTSSVTSDFSTQLTRFDLSIMTASEAALMVDQWQTLIPHAERSLLLELFVERQQLKLGTMPSSYCGTEDINASEDASVDATMRTLIFILEIYGRQARVPLFENCIILSY